MKRFTESFDCLSHGHCRTCRSDPAWRAQVGAPAECPHGVTADNVPVRVLAVPPERLLERLAACAACTVECMMHHLKDCRRRATLNRPDFQCPSGRLS